MRTALSSLLLLVCVAGLHAAKPDGVFQRFDKNGDGKVTRDELPNETAFKRYDLDHDGAITPAEYEKVKNEGTGVPGTPQTQDTSSPEAIQKKKAWIDALIKAGDKNGDGQVSRDEAGNPPWFSRLDTDGDGILSAAELDAARSLLARHDESAGGNRKVRAKNPGVAPEEIQKITSGPEILKPGDVGIGRMIEDTPFTTREGKARRLGDMQGHAGLVVLMTSASCPVSKRYLPGVAELQKELASKNFALLLVNPFASETDEEIEAQLSAAGVTSPYAHDKGRRLSSVLRARTTTEVFLLDATRTLLYRGALDDQYGVNYSLGKATQHFLRDAIAAFLKNEKPRIEATAAPGCEIDLPGTKAADVSTPVTYHRDVERILQQHCVACHRTGGIAPFALDTAEDVTDRAKAVRRVVTEGTMPPWFAAPEADSRQNPWANDCSLPARDKADLLAWIDSRDRPMGDPAEAPRKRSYRSEWSIGTPDFIVSLSRAYDIQATGFMPYTFDVVKTGFTEDRWVSAYEILPSARDVVHHVIVKVHAGDENPRQAGDGTEGYWAAYVPGNGAYQYPRGFARKIPAGATVSFQIHYTPSGTAKKERLRMGLVFAKEPPQYEVKTVGIANPRIAIPPQAPRHVETKSQTVPFDIPVTSFLPHMHVRGVAFKYEVIHPDGRTETLLDIPRYDFNWQLRYDLKQPKLLPRNSTVRITAVYDNSPGNKANPDPTKLVKWGSQTVDEMMLGYLEYFTLVSHPVPPN